MFTCELIRCPLFILGAQALQSNGQERMLTKMEANMKENYSLAEFSQGFPEMKPNETKLNQYSFNLWKLYYLSINSSPSPGIKKGYIKFFFFPHFFLYSQLPNLKSSPDDFAVGGSLNLSPFYCNCHSPR